MIAAPGVCTVLLVGCAPRGATAPAVMQSPHLERVVVVVRHRVRAPLQGEAAAAGYADARWPQWSAPTGLLTPHGRVGVQLSGVYLRQWLVQQGVSPRAGCPAPGSVAVWANTDQRTIDSGALLAEALAPGCGIVVGHRRAGRNAPLFRPIEAGALPFDGTAAVASILQQTGVRWRCWPDMRLKCRRSSKCLAAHARRAISHACPPH